MKPALEGSCSAALFAAATLAAGWAAAGTTSAMALAEKMTARILVRSFRGFATVRGRAEGRAAYRRAASPRQTGRSPRPGSERARGISGPGGSEESRVGGGRFV